MHTHTHTRPANHSDEWTDGWMDGRSDPRALTARNRNGKSCGWQLVFCSAWSVALISLVIVHWNGFRLRWIIRRCYQLSLAQSAADDVKHRIQLTLASFATQTRIRIPSESNKIYLLYLPSMQSSHEVLMNLFVRVLVHSERTVMASVPLSDGIEPKI